MSEWQEMELLFKLLLLPMRLFVHASFEFLGLIREKIFFLFSHDLGSLFSLPSLPPLPLPPFHDWKADDDSLRLWV